MDRSPARADEPGRWWDRLDRLFEQARALPEAEREGFLHSACGDDPELHAELASLLTHGDAGDASRASAPVSSTQHESRGAKDTRSPDPLIGRTLHHYRIEAVVGSGGMGVVYQAVDTRLGRPVALKFIWPRLSTDPAAKERFLVEARAAAALDHPNICTVHEVGEAPEGVLFIAMAYYEGETLKERLSGGPLSIQEAVDVVVQVAGGIGAAHARGIVHRDIKPGNILVTREGVAKLLDFGIAKSGDASLTDPGGAVGTTTYMSPEQFRADSADSRSDVWSLAVVLYELLAGRRPFDGDTPARMLHAVLHEEPAPLAESRPDVPPALEAAIRRALARDPAHRQQSAEELIAELRTAVESDSAARRTPAPSAPRRRMILAGLALALAVPGSLLLRQVAEGTASVSGPAAVGVPMPDAASRGGSSQLGAASVAVLAFEDLSPRADQTWFADGIAEEVLRELSRIEGLRVTVHNSSFSFRGPAIDAVKVGEALGVAHLLAGSVRRGADSIWFTPKLIDAGTGSHLWSETYARLLTAENLREVQSDVARQVARALALRFRTRPESIRAAPENAAYEAYLEGRYHLRRFQSGASRDRQELLRSVEYFRDVVRRTPGWAPGWAALGEAHHWAAYSGIETATHYPESRKALERALELDPDHAVAHASLGYLLHRWERDLGASEAQFRRALELDTDQYWFCGYAFFLLWAGRYDEAIRAGRRQEARDPLYLGLKSYLGSSYRCADRLEDAIRYTEGVLAAHPALHLVPTRRDLVLALERSGRVDEALARLDEAPEPLPYWDLVRSLLLARAGRKAEAETLLHGIDHDALVTWAIQYFPSRIVAPAAIHAAALVALGNPDAATGVLQEAMDRDPATLLYDRCYPELTSLEAEPRYQELLRRSGLPIPPARSGAATAT